RQALGPLPESARSCRLSPLPRAGSQVTAGSHHQCALRPKVTGPATKEAVEPLHYRHTRAPTSSRSLVRRRVCRTCTPDASDRRNRAPVGPPCCLLVNAPGSAQVRTNQPSPPPPPLLKISAA